MIGMEDINRLKLVLVEKKKTSKWLAEQLKKDPSTVSKWCTNVSQPDLVTLSKIAELLNIDRRELINKSKWVYLSKKMYNNYKKTYIKWQVYNKENNDNLKFGK